MQELRKQKKVIILNQTKAGIVHSISEPIKTDYYICTKVVVDIYEGSLSHDPYKLEFYCYFNPQVKVGDYVFVTYKTRSKINKKTKMYYTNNVCESMKIVDEDFFQEPFFNF